MKTLKFLSAKKQLTRWFFLLTLMLCFTFSKANNIQITNVSLIVTGSVKQVQFDLAWDNSWVNWSVYTSDRVYMFFKINNGGLWQHLDITGTDIVLPSGFGGYAGAGGKGIIIAHNLGVDFNGNVAITGVRVGVNIPAIAGNFDVKAFGVEMVYIPYFEFNVGGGGGANAFISTTINTPNAITPPSGTGNYGGQAGGYPTGQTAPNNLWPNGANQFNCMKYEITQQQYVEFLNTLTRSQQSARVATLITGTAVTNRYVMSNTTAIAFRNGIRCDATIPASPYPVNFYCDLNGNGIPNETDDGQSIACNYLSWADLAAYLDWSALRPMTELEFEKICRGTLMSVAGELAWGNMLITGANGINSNSTINEISLNTDANAVYGNASGVQGPMRVGCFAKSATSRYQAGASYYGVMDMSGNLWERTVTIGNATGGGFTGTEGDGVLSTAGDANVATWPGINAIGSGFRGGSWEKTVPLTLQISDRSSAATANTTRSPYFGGRGVKYPY